MRRGLLLWSSLLLAAPSCSDSSTEFWLPKNDLLGMVALDGDGTANPTLAFVEKTTATAFLLDPADPALKPKLVAVGKRPLGAARHTGSNRLLVWTAGDDSSKAKNRVSPQLIVVDPRTASASPLDLTSSFDGLVQSDDGQFAVLYHKPKSVNAEGLFNPNEMMVASFAGNVAGLPALTPRSIRSLGDVPSSIRFSPVYSKGIDHRLAVVLSQNYLTLFDLLNPSQSEISLPLCLSGTGCNYQVDDVVFDPSNFKLYVRASGAKDIFQVSLSESDDGRSSLVASLSMLAVGAAASDMVLYGTGSDARLAVLVPSTKALMIIDPATSNSITVALSVSATRIVPFTSPAQTATGKPRSKALLLDMQKGSTSVVFADFGSAEAASGTSTKQFAISGSVTNVIGVSSYDPNASSASANVVILTFGNSGGSVLSVVNLDTQSFFDFSSGTRLGTHYLEVRRASANARIWSVRTPDDGLPSPDSGIYFRDLPAEAGALAPTIWLDQTITAITPLMDPSGLRYLVLGHADPTGYGNLTLLDARTPDHSTARTAFGFLLTDYLGRNQP